MYGKESLLTLQVFAANPLFASAQKKKGMRLQKNDAMLHPNHQLIWSTLPNHVIKIHSYWNQQQFWKQGRYEHQSKSSFEWALRVQ